MLVFVDFFNHAGDTVTQQSRKGFLVYYYLVHVAHS